MKIAVISDTTYVACAPDDPFCTLYYGSESAHFTLCKALADRGHEMLWYAPRGSTHTDRMEYHPLVLSHGNALFYDDIDTTSLDGSKVSDLIEKKVDFVIDMSASAYTPFRLWKDYQFTNYCLYRNGYEAFSIWGPHMPPEKRNFVVPSYANKRIFDQKSGYKSTKVAYYGIPDFYNPDMLVDDSWYWWYFVTKYNIEQKEYFLYPHRPTVEKGIETVVKLAIDFPKEKFVIINSAPIPEHRKGIAAVQSIKEEKTLDNLIIVDIPMEPRHHYYKRELLRGAKAVLSPFDSTTYKEGFGLANAEAVACGTPLLISDSESTRELWSERDAIICDSNDYQSFRHAISDFNSYTLSPSNRFSVEDYDKRYEEIASAIINNEDAGSTAESLLHAA